MEIKEVHYILPNEQLKQRLINIVNDIKFINYNSTKHAITKGNKEFIRFFTIEEYMSNLRNIVI